MTNQTTRSITTRSITTRFLQTLSHHAYYLIGGDSVCAGLVSELNKHHKIKTQGNPDFSLYKYDTFTIDDARELKSSAEMRPVGIGISTTPGASPQKIFVIQMNGITVEAQNALLKLLEEPAEYVHFFLIIPSAHILLPTVKSRLSFIQTNESTTESTDSTPTTFVKMSIPKRLDHIKKLVEEIAKEKKTKQQAIELLDSIEREVYEKRGAREANQALAAIEKARAYMSDRAPSIKMLLEYVALNI